MTAAAATADAVLRAIAAGHLPATGDAPLWIDLTGAGLADHAQAVAAMDALAARPPEAPGVILALQHQVVATLGRSGGDDGLRGTTARSGDGTPVVVPVHRTGRGGKVTMHVPGQLVVYPVVHLPSLPAPIGRGTLGDLPAYVRCLEAAIVETCGHFGVAAHTRPGFPGVWCSEQDKIASVGVAVRRGWATHGLALNVAPDLALFDLMVPCGLAGVALTSLAAQLTRAGLGAPEVGEVARHLGARLRATLCSIP